MIPISGRGEEEKIREKKEKKKMRKATFCFVFCRVVMSSNKDNRGVTGI